MRTFIALEISDDVRAALAKTIRELAKSPAAVKWVAPESIHVTMKFLGWAEDDKIEKVKAAMAAVKGTGTFTFEVKGLGSFPPEQKPRVVWAGITSGADRIVAVQAMLEDALSPLGFEREDRAFTPHLTLGRVKVPRGAETLVPLIDKNWNTNFGSCEATRISLFESRLSPHGSTYIPVAFQEL